MVERGMHGGERSAWWREMLQSGACDGGSNIAAAAISSISDTPLWPNKLIYLRCHPQLRDRGSVTCLDPPPPADGPCLVFWYFGVCVCVCLSDPLDRTGTIFHRTGEAAAPEGGGRGVGCSLKPVLKRFQVGLTRSWT